jgi:hypothetical protein
MAALILYSLWFKYRTQPPRLIVVSSILSLLLFANSIGEYRSIMIDREKATNWSGAGVAEIITIDFRENFERKLVNPSRYDNLELYNAARIVEDSNERGYLDFGSSLWNSFVHSYFPGQLFGRDFKESLYFDIVQKLSPVAVLDRYPGTTVTGFADAFQSFGVLGFGLFAVISAVFAKRLRNANSGSLVSEVIVILLVSPGVHAITHSTHHFFLELLKIYLFVVPCLYWSLARRPLSARMISNFERSGST